jgi:hypothetical protein
MACIRQNVGTEALLKNHPPARRGLFSFGFNPAPPNNGQKSQEISFA